jgi:ribosomal protein L40E
MPCLRCQTDNSPQAKFCLGCGTRLAIACPACAAELPGGARFCNQCGTPVASAARSPSPESYTPRHLAEKILTSKAALEGERKQVTVLFADLKGRLPRPKPAGNPYAPSHETGYKRDGIAHRRAAPARQAIEAGPWPGMVPR